MTVARATWQDLTLLSPFPCAGAERSTHPSIGPAITGEGEPSLLLDALRTYTLTFRRVAAQEIPVSWTRRTPDGRTVADLAAAPTPDLLAPPNDGEPPARRIAAEVGRISVCMAVHSVVHSIVHSVEYGRVVKFKMNMILSVAARLAIVAWQGDRASVDEELRGIDGWLKRAGRHVVNLGGDGFDREAWRAAESAVAVAAFPEAAVLFAPPRLRLALDAVQTQHGVAPPFPICHDPALSRGVSRGDGLATAPPNLLFGVVGPVRFSLAEDFSAFVVDVDVAAAIADPSAAVRYQAAAVGAGRDG
jgi:hypothetical protein